MKRILFELLILLICFSSFNIRAGDTITWSAGPFKIRIINNSLDIYKSDQKFLTVSSINFNFTKPLSIDVLEKSSSLLSLKCVYPSSAQFRNEEGNVDAIINITFENNSLRFQKRSQMGIKYDRCSQRQWRAFFRTSRTALS